MRKELNRLSSQSFIYHAVPTNPVHEECRIARRKYAASIKAAKIEHWEQYLEKAEEHQLWTANKYLTEPVGDGGRTRIPTLKIVNNEGQTIELNSNDEKAAALARSFFPAKPAQNHVPPNYEYPTALNCSLTITKERIYACVKQLLPHKASGPDGIPNIVLQRSIMYLADYLIHIYRAIFDLNTYPPAWQEFTTAVLRKPGKPSYEVPKAYRPIALLCTMAKVLTAIIAEDIVYIAKQHQLLPDTHFGGRPGRMTTDAVHLLVHRIKDAWRRNKVVSVLFLDIEGAFPNAVTARLIHNMQKRRIPTAYTDFISNLLNGRTTRLRVDDTLSNPIPIDNGVGQGDPISMIIYLFYNADLLDIVDPTNGFTLAFVDDALLAVEGSTFDDTTANLKEIMEQREGGFDWGSNHNSRFEIDKLAVMHCTTKRQTDPTNARRTVPLPVPELKLRGQTIKVTNNYKYLGILVDNKLCWSAQEQHTIAKGTSWILMFRRLTRPITGISAKLMRRLYITVAIPKIMYGADVWYTPPRLKIGKKHRTGSVKMLRALGKIQRIATIAINGALRTTPTDSLDAHANILPVKLMMEKVCHRAVVRTCTLPHTHPLQEVIQGYAARTLRKQPPPLYNLLCIFNIEPGDMETIRPVTRPPSHTHSFTTAKAKSREASIEFEKADTAEIKIFVDGSGIDGNTGAAVVLYRHGRPNPEKTLRYHLGDLTQHTNFEAEAVGLLMAMWMLRNQHIMGRLHVSIYIDSQALISSFSSRTPRSGQYLLEDIITYAEVASTPQKKNLLHLRWISAHSDVPGNEKADEEAKRTAQGASSPSHMLPPLLRNTLPLSTSAIKQNFLKRTKKKWRDQWRASPRYQKAAHIESSLPMKLHAKSLEGLTQAQASLVFQIKTEHIPLNKYLYRIKKIGSDKCTACSQITNRESIESVRHFLFECPAYSNDRRKLDAKLGRNSRDLKAILSNPKHTMELIQYIGRTKRFEPSLGDLTKTAEPTIRQLLMNMEQALCQ